MKRKLTKKEEKILETHKKLIELTYREPTNPKRREMKMEQILKIKVSAYNKTATIEEILKALTEEELQEMFSVVLENMLQTGKIK